MSRKDYEKAARIAQDMAAFHGEAGWRAVVDAFVVLFVEENPRFDEGRFRAACIPAAPIRRPRRGISRAQEDRGGSYGA